MSRPTNSLKGSLRQYVTSDSPISQATRLILWSFWGRAGLGQAEARSLTWGDVDWTKCRLAIKRQKTGARFFVPIYPQLQPLCKDCVRERRSRASDSKVFKIQDAKKGQTSACKRLGFRHFSQRNLRQVLIRQLWQKGVDRKLIAEWQGHRDGGKLIMDTYRYSETTMKATGWHS